MSGDMDIHGVLVPPLIVWFFIALALTGILRHVLIIAGFYNLVWHRALFDAGLFVIALGAVALSFSALGFESPSFFGWTS